MPHVPQDLLDRLAALEREVRQLRGRAQIRPAMNQVLNGDTVIGEGGRLIVRDPDGTPTFETGESPGIGDYYTIIRRDTGAVAVAVGNNSYAGDDAPAQMVRLFDRAGHPIVMDDYHADGWLGRPMLPVPWQPTGATVDHTGALATAWYAYFRAQNPVLYLRTQSATTAASATVRLDLFNLTKGTGYQNIDSWTIGAGPPTLHPVTFPLHGVEYFDEVQLRIQHSTPGTGLVTTDVLGCTGRNTFSASEVPTPP